MILTRALWNLSFLFLQNLSACTDPLRNLVIRCSAKSETSGSPRDTSDLRQEVQMFDSVTERVLQTGFFALASTGDLQSKLKVVQIYNVVYL